MIKSYFQKNILSLIAIIIGVLLFIGIIKLSDIAVCQEYKLFKKNGLKVKALVDHFSSNRAQHYVSYKFELNGSIFISEDQVIKRNFKVGDSVFIYVIPEKPEKIISEDNFKLMGCD